MPQPRIAAPAKRGDARDARRTPHPYRCLAQARLRRGAHALSRQSGGNQYRGCPHGTHHAALHSPPPRENPFPAAVDDVCAVYRELLKTSKPHNIGIYGTSAGAILPAEVAVRLQQLGLPLPAALGIFSGLADFSRVGDSRQNFTPPTRRL